MAWIALFFVWSSPICIFVVIVALALVYFLEIWIDNNFARVKWQLMLKSASVSYTHLDVYKRQLMRCRRMPMFPWMLKN